MRQRPFIQVLTLTIALASAPAWCAGGAQSYHLQDEMFPPEVEEVVAITINGVPVGAMNLDAKRVRDSFALTVQSAPPYHYQLCGHEKLRRRDGSIAYVKIDSAGTLDYLEGRTIGVFGNEHAPFYLRDMDLDERSETPSVAPSGKCADTVAEGSVTKPLQILGGTG